MENESNQNPYIRKLFFQIKRSEYPRIWNTLNSWDWADDLGEKPDRWDGMSHDEKFKISNPIMHFIEVGVGKKAILRYAHVTRDGDTDQMFDDWWDSMGETEKLLEREEPPKIVSQDSSTSFFDRQGALSWIALAVALAALIKISL